jgi:hypothetical protein
MKKRLVLTFAASALLILAGCGNPKTSSSAAPASSAPESSAPASSAPASSAAVVHTAVAISNKADLQKEWRLGDDNRMMTFSFTPADNAAQLIAEGKLAITSSDPTKIAVIGIYLSPVAAGTATITATIDGVTDTVDLTVLAALRDYAQTPLADVLATGVTMMAHTYLTTVKVQSFKSGDNGTSNGNLYVTDTDGNNKVQVYGATASASALSYNATKKVWAFTNPQNYLANPDTAAIKVGDVLNVVLVRNDYNTTKEVMAVILSVGTKTIVNGGFVNAPLSTDAIAAVTTQQNLYTYYVSGKITAWTGTNTDGTESGDFMLKTDGAKGDAITVYGASATGTLAYDATKEKTVFTNPKDWKTNATTSALKIGDTVTLMAIRSDFTSSAGKVTKEIMGVVVTNGTYTAPVVGETTIAALNALKADDTKVVKLSGIATSISDAAYGDGYLTDPTTGESITLGGATLTASALTKTDTGSGYYIGAFSNPKDFTASDKTVACEEGDYVTMEGFATGSTGKMQFKGVITSVVKPTAATYTYKFTASVVTPENGTVVLDKTADLTWGDAVKVTATPDTDYKVDSVVVDHGFGKETLKVASDGTYSFKASVVNKVTVKFVSTVTYTYTSAAKYDLSGYGAAAYAANDGKSSGLSDANALAIFNGGETSVTVTGTNCVTAATGTKIYQAINTQGPKKNGVKVGTTTSGAYDLTLTCSETIRKVSLTVYAWSTSKLATALSVNGRPGVALAAADVAAAKTVDFAFTGSTTVKITTDLAVIVSGIELFTGTANA